MMAVGVTEMLITDSYFDFNPALYSGQSLRQAFGHFTLTAPIRSKITRDLTSFDNNLLK
jgi:hypothetical protein